jgi:hypothetical protein
MELVLAVRKRDWGFLIKSELKAPLQQERLERQVWRRHPESLHLSYSQGKESSRVFIVYKTFLLNFAL